MPQKGYVTADDVTEGKPKPGPYIAGAATLGISPEKCGLSTILNSPPILHDSDIHTPGLVIEDAPSGLKAGQAAGARTLAVCTSHSPETLLREAGGNLDYIVRDLEGCVALNNEPKQ